jgi:hypothetical protein
MLLNKGIAKGGELMFVVMHIRIVMVEFEEPFEMPLVPVMPTAPVTPSVPVGTSRTFAKQERIVTPGHGYPRKEMENFFESVPIMLCRFVDLCNLAIKYYWRVDVAEAMARAKWLIKMAVGRGRRVHEGALRDGARPFRILVESALGESSG